MSDIDWVAKAQQTPLAVKHLINGELQDAAAQDAPITKHFSRDGRLLYRFDAGSAATVDQAVSAARATFEAGDWANLPVPQRQAVLERWAELMEQHSEELALYDCLDVGKPISAALHQDVPLAANTLRDCARSMSQLFSLSGSDGGLMAYQVRKPVGVVGSIIGWNFPLWMIAIKAAPALAMGNSLVVKPSEFTPLSATRFAELALEAGLPPGVFNVVQGGGATVGAALAWHNDVDLLSFTGSTATGKKMQVAAGESNMKRLMLECGGKSPYIVFDDCPENLDVIAADIVETAFGNQGEWCSAGTRLLIQDSLKAKLLPKVVALAAELKPQDPLQADTQFGALMNEAHLQKVLGYIEQGKQQGAELLLGGERSDITIAGAEGQGSYLGPTIFDQVDPDHRIAQEEIFGPVLSVISFSDEAEAIRIANNTCYGLAAYAATENLGRAQRLARQLRSGHLTLVGTTNFSEGSVALGGEPQKQSGFGAKIGLAGLAAYTVSTSVHLYS